MWRVTSHASCESCSRERVFGEKRRRDVLASSDNLVTRLGWSFGNFGEMVDRFVDAEEMVVQYFVE
jgi:hypothetical protein